MTISFLLLAAITIVGTAAAMSLKNLVHCVLALTLGLVGLAALYLQLGAQFVGFTQILVYVGAVAILAVFAIMMTRSAEPTERTDLLLFPPVRRSYRCHRICGSGMGHLLRNRRPASTSAPQPEASVHQIGVALMHSFVLPLEIIGLLLTAALIGAGVLAMEENRGAR